MQQGIDFFFETNWEFLFNEQQILKFKASQLQEQTFTQSQTQTKKILQNQLYHNFSVSSPDAL